MAGDQHYSEGIINKTRLRNVAAGVRFDMEGEWIRASKLMRDLPMDLKKALFAGQEIFAQKYKEKLVYNINNNGGDIRWEPLKAKYASQKRRDKRAKFPNDIGRYRGYMADGIKIYHKGNYQISIGISKTNRIMGVGKENELTLAQYANIFEHGSVIRNIAARPLFAPTYRKMGGNIGLTKIVLASVSIVMKAKYGITV